MISITSLIFNKYLLLKENFIFFLLIQYTHLSNALETSDGIPMDLATWWVLVFDALSPSFFWDPVSLAFWSLTFWAASPFTCSAMVDFPSLLPLCFEFLLHTWRGLRLITDFESSIETRLFADFCFFFFSLKHRGTQLKYIRILNYIRFFYLKEKSTGTIFSAYL